MSTNLFQNLSQNLKKTLLPSMFLLTLEYLICLVYLGEAGLRLGIVFGFVVGQINIWSMALIIAKMFSAKETKNMLFLGFLLLLKVLILFALVAGAAWLFGLSLLGVAAGYLSVLFLVVLSVGLRYTSPA